MLILTTAELQIQQDGASGGTNYRYSVTHFSESYPTFSIKYLSHVLSVCLFGGKPYEQFFCSYACPFFQHWQVLHTLQEINIVVININKIIFFIIFSIFYSVIILRMVDTFLHISFSHLVDTTMSNSDYPNSVSLNHTDI